MLAPGQLLEGKYEIVRVIGEGAWGEVLEGINIRIKRRVAIKILKAEYASNEQMVSRFEREALASTHIESPHVVQVFDAGVLDDGRPYMVMEFLTGEDLSARIESMGKLPILMAVEVCAQAARGLAAAHSAGIFHRDMKPSNIVVAKTKAGQEVAKIVDFGISKLLDVDTKKPTSNTQTGTILGSPVYMSPEQARGSKATDHRSDIYSLGVVLFECLTGRTPQVADSFNELLFKIVLEEVPSVRTLRPEIDEELESIMQRMMAKAPENRVASAAELEVLLFEWLAKNGSKVADWRSDSGTRPHDRAAIVAAGLDSSPVIGTAKPATQTLPIDPTSSSRLLAAVARERDASAPTIPAPPESDESDKNIGKSDSEKNIAAAPVTLTERPARPAWLIPAIGLGLAVVIGGIVVASRSPVPPAANASPEKLPTATATATNVATAATSATASAIPAETAAASASTPASSSAAAETPDAPHKHPVVGGGRPRPMVTASASAATSAVAAPATGPATAPTNSASVGGRTIRTDINF